MCLYRCARASNGSDAAETSLSVLIRQAALNELTLTALVAGITSSLFQMSAQSNERTAADYFGKQPYTERRSWSLCDHLSNHFRLKRPLDRSSPNYQISLVLKKKAGVDFHQFLVLSAISHSPLKLFKVQSSKAYGKSGAAKAAPAAPLPMAKGY